MLPFEEKNTELEEKRKKERRRFLVLLKRKENGLAILVKEEARGERWKEEEQEARLLQSNLFRVKNGMKKIEVEDWENEGKMRTLTLDSDLEPGEFLKRKFVHARKLKRKLAHAKEQIARVRKEIALLEEKLKAVEVQESFEEPKTKKAAEKKAHPFREFTTEAGLKIYVAKKDRDNEKLTFSFAHGNDLWMHVADRPGAHLIIRCPKGKVVDEASLLDAALLAVHFSKAKGEKIADVTVAEVKHVSKPKRAKAGLVNVSKHKKITVRSDPARLKQLLTL